MPGAGDRERPARQTKITSSLLSEVIFAFMGFADGLKRAAVRMLRMSTGCQSDKKARKPRKRICRQGNLHDISDRELQVC